MVLPIPERSARCCGRPLSGIPCGRLLFVNLLVHSRVLDIFHFDRHCVCRRPVSFAGASFPGKTFPAVLASTCLFPVLGNPLASLALRHGGLGRPGYRISDERPAHPAGNLPAASGNPVAGNHPFLSRAERNPLKHRTLHRSASKRRLRHLCLRLS